MCRWAAISEIVSQEWLRTTFLWTGIKTEAAFPRQRQPGCNSGDGAHRDWFRPSYWHPTSQNRRHQKRAWDCSPALLWLCFFFLLSFLFIWPDFHVIFFHVLWTFFIFLEVAQKFAGMFALLPTQRKSQRNPPKGSAVPGLWHLRERWVTVTEEGSLWDVGLMRWVEEGEGLITPFNPASWQLCKVPSWLTKWSCLISITLLGVLMPHFSDSLFPFFFFFQAQRSYYSCFRKRSAIPFRGLRTVVGVGWLW